VSDLNKYTDTADLLDNRFISTLPHLISAYITHLTKQFVKGRIHGSAMELMRYVLVLVLCCVKAISSDGTCGQVTCNTEGLPRTYLAYHLNNKTINIDGVLDDEAWLEVAWTDTFMGKKFEISSDKCSKRFRQYPSKVSSS